MSYLRFNKKFILLVSALSVISATKLQAFEDEPSPNSSLTSAQKSLTSKEYSDEKSGSNTQQSDDEHHDEVESILVTSTRFGRSINDEPVRVEIVNREELEEKAIMRPGNISMLVAETANTSSLDIGYQLGKLETNITFFTSSVDNVTELEAFASQSGGPLAILSG